MPLARLLSALVLAWFSVTAAAGVLRDRQPNIVFFVLDDVSADDLGAYGNAGIRTPNIDRLAQAGWRFDNAFLNTSVCSPSRISLLTGRYPHATGARNLHQPLPEGQRLLSAYLREQGYFTAAAGKWHMGEYARAQFDRVLQSARHEVAQDWLQVVENRPREKPFFLWLATYDAHRPFDAPVTLHGHAPSQVMVPAGLVDDQQTRADLAAYYATIHRADMEIGFVLAALRQQGVLDNTLVVVIADNGRSFPWAKGYLYDASLKTPLIMHWPDALQAASSDVLVSGVDIAPTLLDWFGMPVPATMQGVSFAPVFSGSQQAVREAVFAERNWRGIHGADARSVRTRDFLYIRTYAPARDSCLGVNSNADPASRALLALQVTFVAADPLSRRCFPANWPAEELYVVSSDPGQQDNRAPDPAMQPVLMEMRARLADWQQASGDYRSRRLMPLSESWCRKRNQVGCY